MKYMLILKFKKPKVKFKIRNNSQKNNNNKKTEKELKSCFQL